jgi:hypothetical protein
MDMTRVVLHIDRLVLRGIDRGDAGAVSAALQERLHALLAADGGAALREQGATHRLRTTAAPVPADAGAAAIGHAVAERIAGAPAPFGPSTRGGPR